MGKQKNTEIEIRIRIKDPSKLRELLKKSGKKLNIFHQTDYYFDPPDRSFIFIDQQGFKDATEWLRVRLAKKGDSICYKNWHRDKKGHSLYAEEIETPISNGKLFIDLLKKLGFKMISVIKKSRESWELNEFEIDFDKVERLGYFIEIEYKGEIKNLSKGRKKIIDFLQTVELKDWEIIDRGYPWMRWNFMSTKG